MDACDGPGGNETCATARFGAPGDFLALGVTDGIRTLGWSPHAPVYAIGGYKTAVYKKTERSILTINVVDERRLAEGVGTLSGGVAKVVAGLRATKEIVRVGFVRLL